MSKYTGIIFSILILIIIGIGCVKSPNTPVASKPELALELEFHNAPFGASLDGNTVQATGSMLNKANAIIELPVVVLNFDENIGETAHDESGFENNAYLTNTEWDVSSDGDKVRRTVALSGLNSYGQIYDYYYQLSGVYGVSVDVVLNVFDSQLAHQIIVDKIDYKGDGYRMGLIDRVPYFEISKDNVATRITSNSALNPNQWYSLRGQFSPSPPYLQITNAVDTTFTFESDRINLNVSSSNLTIGAGTTGSFGVGNYLNGYIDELVIKTSMQYEEFDLVRVGVLDANIMVESDTIKNLTSEELSSHFYENEIWQDVYSRMDRIFYSSDTTAALNWGNIRELWDQFYSTISEQNLAISNGFAEGTVNGVPGLNILSVGAMRGDRMVYYGYGFVYAFSDRSTNAYIHMWQVE